MLVGRPTLWGLSVRGADGVRDVLGHLRQELVRTMALCGVAKLADATPDLVANGEWEALLTPGDNTMHYSENVHRKLVEIVGSGGMVRVDLVER